MDPETKKEIKNIKQAIEPASLSPKIINQFIKTRAANTNYIGGGNTLDCDVMLEVEWNGQRYRLPAFVV